MGVQTNDPSQALQAALAAVEQQYDKAVAFLNAMKNDSTKITQDLTQAAYDKSHEHYHWAHYVGGTVITGTGTRQSMVDGYNACEADIANMHADIAQKGADLQKCFPDMANLCASLGALLSCIEGTISNHNIGGDLASSDCAAVSKLLNTLFAAMKQKLEGDMYDAALHSDAADNLSASELSQLAMQMLGAQSGELNDLNQMMGAMRDLMSNLNTDSENAKADHARYNFWDELGSAFGSGNALGNESRDDRIMDNAASMCEGLAKVMTALTPEIASVMPGFAQVIDVIQQVIKEVKELLANVKMSPKEKKGAITALCMFLLTYFQVVKQDVESQKAENNQDMTKGAIEASKINILDTTTNQTIKEEAERNAKIMKITMIVMQVVVGALMMIAAPGVGTALMVGLMTAFETMQTAGVFNATGALGNAIGGKNGQIFADVIVGVTEAALTMGGGAILDRVAATVIKELVEEIATEALEIAQESIEKAAQSAAEAIGKVGDQTATDAAETVLTKVSFRTAEKAAQGAAQQFMSQPFGTLVELFAKGSLTKTMNEVMAKAAQEAIETGLDDAATIAKLAARGVQSSDMIIDGIATKAANQAVAKASGKEVATVAKEAENSAQPGKTALTRGAAALLFGISSNNLWVDVAKRTGADKDDGLMIFLQVLQQLLQMIAMMGGSGMMSGSTMDGVVSRLPRAAGYLSMIPQAGEAAASYSNYMTYGVEGKAVTALAMNGSVSDLLHSFLEQLQKDGNLDRDIMIKEQQQGQQSTQALAGHLHDGDQAAIQALIAAV